MLENLVPPPGPHHVYLPLPAGYTNLPNSLTSAQRGSNSLTIHRFLKGATTRKYARQGKKTKSQKALSRNECRD